MTYEEVYCGEEVLKVPKPECYGDCIKLMQSDFYRYTGKTASFTTMLFSCHCTFRLNFWLRLSSYRGWAYYLTKFMLNRTRRKTGIDIIETTRIGYGFLLNHNMSVVINPTAVIGNNVYIGPSVCIVENVSIGSNSTIGAGAVVNKNIPSGVTAAGVPAKILNRNPHTEYIQRPWTDTQA